MLPTTYMSQLLLSLFMIPVCLLYVNSLHWVIFIFKIAVITMDSEVSVICASRWHSCSWLTFQLVLRLHISGYEITTMFSILIGLIVHVLQQAPWTVIKFIYFSVNEILAHKYPQPHDTSGSLPWTNRHHCLGMGLAWGSLLVECNLTDVVVAQCRVNQPWEHLFQFVSTNHCLHVPTCLLMFWLFMRLCFVCMSEVLWHVRSF